MTRDIVCYCVGFSLISIFSSVAVAGQVCDSSFLPRNASYTNKFYNEGTNVWLNPGRGFYHKLITSSNTTEFEAIQESILDCWRTQDGTTLLLRLYLLDDSVSGAQLTSDFLDRIRHDMATVHKAGWNVIVRFMYNTGQHSISNSKTSEPTVDIIAAHIEQLAVIFQGFEGVITSIQAGFLGRSGCWYEPSAAGGSFPPKTTYTQLLDALFKSVPTSLPIQVPKPEYKQEYLGPMSTSYLDVITNSDKLRVGFFRDCLPGSDINHQINAFPRLDPTSISNMSYLSIDTKFNIMGGRTCHPGDIRSGPDLCTDSVKLFQKIHMTYLDIEDPAETLKYYKQQNCYNNIRQRLGYQLFLHTVNLPTEAEAGGYMCFHVSLVNKGFATPARDVHVFLVLQLNSTVMYQVDLHVKGESVKLWQPGHVEIPLVTKSFQLVHDMPAGLYKVHLALSDPKWQNDSNYYILLGGEYRGKPTADPSTGLNFIGEVQIRPSSAHSSSTPASSATLPPGSMRPWSALATTRHLREWKEGYVTCDEVEVTKALLQYTYFNSSLALPCPDTNPHSSEAILQRFCHAQPASRWSPVTGVKVIDHCDEIAKFTPVAFFKSLLGVSVYDRGLNDGMAGVFFGCVKKNGILKSIKVGIQLCGFPFDVTLIHPGDVDLQSLYIVNTL
ncbi:uncharacterized protein LOC132550662 [Ylistrum balloti]|uniref:uncharacterized protein LOC132550662 n=1 Tax=Ylistrum balloti TaxID=509963 RepID=UPI002905BCD7|nr:uncharacterized protein LOC132550662 [Ylistrum balloti]